MKETDKAYIAGLLDGEAYIGIKKITKPYNGGVNPSYQERIQVRMVDEQSIKFLSEMFGGNYYKEKPNAKNGRPLYCFQASYTKAVKIITEVLPYLKVKREVALKVLELRGLRNNPEKESYIIVMTNRWGFKSEFNRLRLSVAHIERCENLYLACKSLNAVGI